MSNTFMRLMPLRMRSPGLKLLVLFVAACGAGLGLITWLRTSNHKITDQELLREAVAEWKRAGEPGEGPNYQIFEQQAAQGYYEDAAATGRLFKRADDVQWSIVELVKIRAENGDIQGAKNSIKSLAGSALQKKGAEVVALIQAQNGDLSGALETIVAFGESDEVFLEYGRRQIEMGDFEGALDTAGRTKSGYQLFYDIGDALRIRGEQSRAGKLAAHMKDRKFAALFLDCARFTLWPTVPERVIVQATPCDIANYYGLHGRFVEADALIEHNKCANVSFVAIRQYAVDPSGAEHLLRGASEPLDLTYGLEQLAVQAANKGDIAETLRFLNDLSSLTTTRGGASRVRAEAAARSAEAVHEIARAWTIKDGPRVVLKWAHSRPTTGERTWALLGMAETLGHARPTQ